MTELTLNLSVDHHLETTMVTKCNREVKMQTVTYNSYISVCHVTKGISQKTHNHY